MIMLEGPTDDDETAERWTVQVSTGDRAWTARLDHGVVTVSAEPQSGTDAQVSGDPGDMLLWLWGRGPLEPLQLSGDPDAASALRRSLAMAT